VKKGSDYQTGEKKKVRILPLGRNPASCGRLVWERVVVGGQTRTKRLLESLSISLEGRNPTQGTSFVIGSNVTTGLMTILCNPENKRSAVFNCL
jgi:hypothetical protein